MKFEKDGGASPLFPPQHQTEAEAKMALLQVVRRMPKRLGYARSRWSLRMIMQSCQWLRLKSKAGLSQLLKRLGISYKRAGEYLYSPDRYYEAKLSLIELCRLKAWYEPERHAFLYLDELTYYRQPSLSRAYEAVGPIQPLARRSYRSNTCFRVVGALDALSGRVLYCQHDWPVHFHPDVLARLQPQQFPWPPNLPANWPTDPSSQAVQDELPIQILCLPTYASWLSC